MFSAYFVKLIHELIHSELVPDMLAICLSGQHEMVEDFSGFRNFFTLNFIAKPIYNVHILANKLGENLLAATYEENLFVIPTKDENGNYAVMVSYSSANFEEDLPTMEETLSFCEDIVGRHVTIWRIDKNTMNPYRMWEREGKPEMSKEVLRRLREEGCLKPSATFTAKENFITLSLTPNATVLVALEERCEDA